MDAAGDNYVYCNNNPVKYIDPTGNVPVVAAAIIRGAVLARRYAVPAAYAASNAAVAYTFGCDKGYVSEGTQSKINAAVNAVGQSGPAQYAKNEMGIRFGYERVDAIFWGIGVGSQQSKSGDLQMTSFTGSNERRFLDGEVTKSSWENRPSVMYWRGKNLGVWADMGNDTSIWFHERESMSTKGVFKVFENTLGNNDYVSGVAKFDFGHMHTQATVTKNNTVYSFRPTAGAVTKLNTIDDPTLPIHATATPFSRRGLFIQVEQNKFKDWVKGGIDWLSKKLGF